MEEKIITKDMTVHSVLELDQDLGDVFMGIGMCCIVCHLGSEETIEQACATHDIDLDFLLAKLNETYNQKKK